MDEVVLLVKVDFRIYFLVYSEKIRMMKLFAETKSSMILKQTVTRAKSETFESPLALIIHAYYISMSGDFLECFFISLRKTHSQIKNHLVYKRAVNMQNRGLVLGRVFWKSFHFVLGKCEKLKRGYRMVGF